MTFGAKKNFVLFTRFFLLFLLILGFLYYLFFIYSIEESKYLKNITELYSSFTEYMKEIIDYRLELLDCQPKKYYYDNSNVCFVCDKTHACFGFSWVDKEGGKKMNPQNLPYLKIEEIDIKAADFYRHGLASGFNCNKKDENRLECDNGLIFVKDDLNIKMFITNLDNFEEVSKKICIYFNYEFEECGYLSCICEKILIVAREENGEIILVW